MVQQANLIKYSSIDSDLSFTLPPNGTINSLTSPYSAIGLLHPNVEACSVNVHSMPLHLRRLHPLSVLMSGVLHSGRMLLYQGITQHFQGHELYFQSRGQLPKCFSRSNLPLVLFHIL